VRAVLPEVQFVSAAPNSIDFALASMPGSEMHETLETLRHDGPLARVTFGGRPAVLITSHALLIEGFREVEKFPPAKLYQISIGKTIGRNFQTMEGAQHRLYRRLATPAFRSRAVERFGRQAMAGLAKELIERFAARSEVDLVADFTHLFPFLVISRLLGVPRQREEQFHRWAWEMLSPPSVEPETSRRAAAEFIEYLKPAVELRRREPQGDVISELVIAEADGRRLTDSEIFSHVQLMFAAGATTTCDAIGNLLHALLTRPKLWRRLVEDPSLRDAAVLEGLRYDTPVANLPRISATRTVEFGGCEIPPESFVLFSMAAANRDPVVFPNPHRFDLTRADGELLTFGRGERSCPGMHLALKGIGVALDALAGAFPKLRLRGDPTLSAPRGALVRGPKTLPVALH
jgi:cytochrome P450